MLGALGIRASLRPRVRVRVSLAPPTHRVLAPFLQHSRACCTCMPLSRSLRSRLLQPSCRRRAPIRRRIAILPRPSPAPPPAGRPASRQLSRILLASEGTLQRGNFTIMNPGDLDRFGRVPGQLRPKNAPKSRYPGTAWKTANRYRVSNQAGQFLSIHSAGPGPSEE